MVERGRVVCGPRAYRIPGTFEERGGAEPGQRPQPRAVLLYSGASILSALSGSQRSVGGSSMSSPPLIEVRTWTVSRRTGSFFFMRLDSPGRIAERGFAR